MLHTWQVLKLRHNATTTLMFTGILLSIEHIYLGYAIRIAQLELIEVKTTSQYERSDSTAQTEVISILTLCNKSYPVLPSFTRMGAPLDRNLRKWQPASFPLSSPARRRCSREAEESAEKLVDICSAMYDRLICRGHLLVRFTTSMRDTTMQDKGTFRWRDWFFARLQVNSRSWQLLKRNVWQ